MNAYEPDRTESNSHSASGSPYPPPGAVPQAGPYPPPNPYAPPGVPGYPSDPLQPRSAASVRPLLLILLGTYLALVVITYVLWVLTGIADSAGGPVITVLVTFVPTLLFVGLAFFEVATRRDPYASVALGVGGVSSLLPTINAIIVGFFPSAQPTTQFQTLLSVIHFLAAIVTIAIGIIALVSKTLQRASTPVGVTAVGSVAVYLAYQAIATTIGAYQHNAMDTGSFTWRYVPNVAKFYIFIERDQTSLFHVQGSWIVTAIVGILALVTLAVILNRGSLMVLRTVLVPGLLVCYVVAVIQAISSWYVGESRVVYSMTASSISEVLVGAVLTALALLVYGASVTRWFTDAKP